MDGVKFHSITEFYGPEACKTLISLISYCVSINCRNHDDWKEWGVPYLFICGKLLGISEADIHVLENKFLGNIGQGYKFIVESDADEDDWLHIKPGQEFVKELIGSLEEVNLDDLISSYLSSITMQLQLGYYGPRERVISHRICSLFQVPPEIVHELELTKANSNKVKLADISFEVHHPSYITPQRLWKIGLAAASGGALMIFSGGSISTAALVTSIVNMIGMSSTTTQLLINITTLLTNYGIRALSTITTLGAGTAASWSMLKITAPIEDFHFSMLHQPTTLPLTQSIENVIVESTVEEQKDKPDSNLGITPLFILIPGPFDKKLHPSELFGGDFPTNSKADPSEESKREVMATTQIEVTTVHNVELMQLKTVDSEEVILEEFKVSEFDTVTVEDSFDPMKASWEHIIPSNRNWWRDTIPKHLQGSEYVLCWESEVLHSLYNKQKYLLMQNGAGMMIDTIVKQIINFSTILSSISGPIAIARKIFENDNPWTVALIKSKQAGERLAELLLSLKVENGTSEASLSCADGFNEHLMVLTSHKQAKCTPSVTLLGFSVGATVIYHCLAYLYRQPNNRGLGIVENVVMIGAAVTSSPHDWKEMRAVVSGRLVNCYSTHDWFLALLYRVQSWNIGVAGLQPIHLEEPTLQTTSPLPQKLDEDPNEDPVKSEMLSEVSSWSKEVENIDVTSYIHSYVDYSDSLPIILSKVFEKKK